MTTQGRPPSEPIRTGPTGASTSTPGMTDRVQETAGRVVDTVQETARPAVDRATDTVQQVAEQASEQVTSRLDMVVDYAADSLTGVAQALRQTGQHLREDGAQPALGRYADTSAQQVERLGGYLRQHDATELLSNVETYARRNPMTFAGGAFALGLLAARFFRATGQRPHAPPPRTGMSYQPSSARMPGTSNVPPMTRTAPPVAVPRYGSAEGLATSTPPSYANRAPAARTVPASPDWTPPRTGGTSSPGTSTTGHEAERLTPAPGSQSGTGTAPSTGATPNAGRAPASGGTASTGGTASPGAAPTSRPGSGSPTREGGTPGGTSPSTDRPGPGTPRQV